MHQKVYGRNPHQEKMMMNTDTTKKMRRAAVLAMAGTAVVGVCATVSPASAASGDVRRTDTVTFLDGTYMGCHYYAKAIRSYTYNQKSKPAKVKDISQVAAAAGCPLVPVTLKLGNVDTYSRSGVTYIDSTYKLTIAAGVPTPWGTVGKTTTKAGSVITVIPGAGAPWSYFVERS